MDHMASSSTLMTGTNLPEPRARLPDLALCPVQKYPKASSKLRPSGAAPAVLALEFKVVVVLREHCPRARA
eukprot:545582-Rhodomonas_salina.3